MMRGIGLYRPKRRPILERCFLVEDASRAFAVEEQSEFATVFDEVRRLLPLDFDTGQLGRGDLDIAVVAMVVKGDAGGNDRDCVSLALDREDRPAAGAAIERGRPLER